MKKQLVSLAVTTTVLFSTNLVEVSAREFSDVSPGRWSYESIENISNKCLINGYEDGSFKPANTITRAEAAVIINNYLFKEERLSENYSSNNFSDVPTNTWYTQAVNNTYHEGIFSGDGKGHFNPNSTLTRAEMVSIFNRVEEYEKKADYQFSDVLETDWYAEDVKIAYSNGIINGIQQPNGNMIFKGRGQVTREQFVTVLNNVYNYDPDFVAEEIPTVITSLEESVQTVFEIINRERIKVGVEPLILSSTLTQAAQLNAENMALRNDYLSTYDEFEDLLNSFEIYPETAVQTWANGDEDETAEEEINYLITTDEYEKMIDPTYQEVGIGWSENDKNLNFLSIMYVSNK